MRKGTISWLLSSLISSILLKLSTVDLIFAGPGVAILAFMLIVVVSFGARLLLTIEAAETIETWSVSGDNVYENETAPELPKLITFAVKVTSSFTSGVLGSIVMPVIEISGLESMGTSKTGCSAAFCSSFASSAAGSV